MVGRPSDKTHPNSVYCWLECVAWNLGCGHFGQSGHVGFTGHGCNQDVVYSTLQPRPLLLSIVALPTCGS